MNYTHTHNNIPRNLIFSKFHLFNIVDLTEWLEWSPWSNCFNKHVKKARCWRSANDRPMKRRVRSCSPGASSDFVTCIQETRDCTELPACPIGNSM